MRASAYRSTAASRANGGVSMVLCDAIVCSRWRRSKATKGKEGNGHNDAHYCDSRRATPVRRGRLLLEGPATVGRSSARTCGNSSTRNLLLGTTKGARAV